MGSSAVAALVYGLDGTQVAVAGIASAAGVLGSVAAIIAAWNARAAKKELRPNGGSSARDDISQRLDVMDRKLDHIVNAVAGEVVTRELNDGILAGRLDRLEGKAKEKH